MISQGEFYSIAITNNYQQADTGTKMVHQRQEQPSSTHRLQGHQRAGKCVRTPIAASYRVAADRERRRATITQCDSLLLGGSCGAHTVPYIEVKNNPSRANRARGDHLQGRTTNSCSTATPARAWTRRRPWRLIVNGFAKDVLKELPMEFAMEAQQLDCNLAEGSVG